MIWEIDEGRKVVEGLDEDGRPDPAYAAALGLRPAPLGRRALASIIEFAFYAVLQLPYWIVALPTLLKVATGALQPYGLVAHPDFVWMVVATAVSAVLTIAFVVVQIVLHGRKGVTLGKAIAGIRSIDAVTLARPRIPKALGRALLLYVAFAVPVVGPALLFSSVFFDGERRGRSWLDKAAGTWFVDVRAGLDPYHEKKMRIARKTVRAEPEQERSELPSLATPADRLAQAYRPGARTSSGVVGAAKPQRPGYRPGTLSGLPQAGAAEAPAAAPAPSGPRYVPPLAGGIVDSVPGRAPSDPPAASSANAAPPAAYAAPPAAPIDEQTIVEPDLEMVAADDDALDDRTVRRVEVVEPEDDLDATRARTPAREPIATLAFDTGDRFAIHGAALIGRNPAPAAGEVVEHLLPVADDTRSISKTHLLITVSPLAAVDRASTNGSSVVRAGAETVLQPSSPFFLQPGDVVRFGDRSVLIEAPARSGRAA